MANEKPRTVLQFNEYDFRHRKVLEILRARPRNKTELVVNAILHYVSCPNAAEDFNKEAIKQIIREVLAEMQSEGSLQITSAAGSSGIQVSDQDVDELGGMMAAFRGE